MCVFVLSSLLQIYMCGNMAPAFTFVVVMTFTFPVEAYSINTINRGDLIQEAQNTNGLENRTVDDFMKGLQGSCLEVYPNTNPEQLLKYTTQFYNRIKIYREAMDMKRKIAEEVQAIFAATWNNAEYEKIFDVMLKDSEEVCQGIDCSDVYPRITGLHNIHVDNMKPFQVMCNMDVDGGNWTVIQQRHDGSVDFQRTWQEYKVGFGNLQGEFWLGNDKINSLTRNGRYELHVSITSWEGQTWHALYKQFSVGDEESKYLLTIGQYSGNAGDSMSYHNGMKFSTIDSDNDLSSSKCTASHGDGGWWYNGCDNANLNGLHTKGSGEQGIEWTKAKSGYSMMYSRMMIRRY